MFSYISFHSTQIHTYTDDILLVENSNKMIDTAKKWLSSNFEMKDMGEVSYVLGVKIVRDRAKRLLDLFQETYIKGC